MDNRSHDETDWDLDVLNLELQDLKLDDIDLQLTGFDLPEIERSLAVGRDDEAANEAPAPLADVYRQVSRARRRPHVRAGSLRPWGNARLVIWHLAETGVFDRLRCESADTVRKST